MFLEAFSWIYSTSISFFVRLGLDIDWLLKGMVLGLMILGPVSFVWRAGSRSLAGLLGMLLSLSLDCFYYYTFIIFLLLIIIVIINTFFITYLKSER
jgi:hypothetical protein